VGPRAVGHRLATFEYLEDTQFPSPLQYDATGQLIDTQDQGLFYDAMGRLIAPWSGQPTETEAYVWAGPTELVGQGLATGLGNGYGRSEHFVYDGPEKLVAYGTTAQGPLWEAIWGSGLHQLIEWRDLSGQSPGVYIVVADHRNSIVSLYDTDGLTLTEIVTAVTHLFRETVRETSTSLVFRGEALEHLIVHPLPPTRRLARARSA
jgi:hypothetical protein